MAERIEGHLDIVDSDGRRIFQFDADNRRIFAWDEEGHRVLRYYAHNAQLYVGGEGNEGDFFVTDGAGHNFLRADSGGHRLFLYDGEGRRVLTFYGHNAQLYVGGEGNEGDLYVVHPSGVNTIQMDGNSGDIILRNADAAEEFHVAADEHIDPGSVVVVDDSGSVRACTKPYDRRVAGIVSGAGEHRPGLVLDRQADAERVPVALMGKVSCRVDATDQPVAVGDLLTTSATPGHAMRVADDAPATGAVIGKALQPLTSQSGLLPVLVALQ